MDPKQIVDSYTQDVSALAARAAEARERIRHLAGTASSQDGAVTVTVNGGGALQGLSFGPAADHVPRVRLAELVMTTARRAQAQASQQIIAIMTPLVGENSDAMRFVEEQIPPSVLPETAETELSDYPGGQALNEDLAEPAPPPPPPDRQEPAPARRRPIADDEDETFGMDSPLSREEDW
ncbi:YbaB/EbfC family nucleoid-associated protein [Actinophytocola sp.]|uniref:YbaB/EbfC family nucleoid-associated protein n=1 Tax=Actinophytocola sp. TaxID=1872138 RepID=UPI002D3A252F|nr:YbaB/EbfC family nucleoid-associated protein [Actinophytocola sp.]HYQ65340.1 YbaB/EbfC family nucleoid-associated protein [Actinophytocola sp.]